MGGSEGENFSQHKECHYLPAEAEPLTSQEADRQCFLPNQQQEEAGAAAVWILLVLQRPMCYGLALVPGTIRK
jgi:hypothetical protein